MRAVVVVFALTAAGCAELALVTDGTSVSYGKPNRGYLLDGTRLPDKGEGFTTREVWQKRGNRYGTDEMVDLLTGVSRRLRSQIKDARLVIADLSGGGGGAATKFHRSHQTGRDADILYYLRDAEGKPVEPETMIVLDRQGFAKDKSGISVDVPRTWLLVRELMTAPEATVQFVFMYEPISQMLIEHAKQIGEPEFVIARARRALKQPGDSARHDDHMHVRIYCAPDDREFGCIDIGPTDLLAEREAEKQRTMQAIAESLPRADRAPTPSSIASQAMAATIAAGSAPAPVAAAPGTSSPAPGPFAAGSAAEAWAASMPPTQPGSSPASLSSLLRARAGRIDLRGWR